MQDPDIHILSTKNISEELLKQAVSHGIAVDVFPFISTTLLAPKTFSDNISTANSCAVFTSSNAVKAVAQWANAAQQEWKVYCLEGNTMSTVKKLLPAATITGTAASAKALADIIVQDGVKSLNFFSGNIRREELPAQLKHEGVEVNEVVVYNTTLTSVKLEDTYQGIMFFSPSAVESYLMENELSDGMVLFAIGHTTAAALKGFDNTVVVSSHPSAEELMKLVISHFQVADKKI